MIHIDNEPYATDKWYSGVYTKDYIDYTFSLFYSRSEYGHEGITITWVEEAPPEYVESIENEIRDYYNNR